MSVSGNGNENYYSSIVAKSNVNVKSSTNQQPITYVYNESNFANVREDRPKRNCAIILDQVEDAQINDYVKIVGQYVGAANIKFAFRYTHHRICIYFANKNILENFISNHSHIKVLNQNVEVQRLVSPSQRVVITCNCPSIPNYVMEHMLHSLGIKLKSPVVDLKVGIVEKDYSHVYSSRRQTFISPEQISLLPDSIIISNFEDSKIRIYFSTEITCFACKEKGHMAHSCPNKEANNSNTANIANSLLPEVSNAQDVPQTSSLSREAGLPDEMERAASHRSEESVLHPDIDVQVNALTPEKTPEIDPSSVQTTKRPATNTPSISSIEDETCNQTDADDDNSLKLTPNNNQNAKLRSKRQKSITPTGLATLTRENLEPLKIHMESNKYALNFNELIVLLENLQTSENYLDTIEKSTDNLFALIYSLQELKIHLHGSTKNKFTRLINMIKEQMDKKTEDTNKPIPNPNSPSNNGNLTMEQ